MKYKPLMKSSSSTSSPRAQDFPQKSPLSSSLEVKEKGKSEPEKQLETKTFENLISINKAKVTLGNLESELWKKNISSGPRHNKDYLDVSAEDFTKNTSVSIDGKEITPSSKIAVSRLIRYRLQHLPRQFAIEL